MPIVFISYSWDSVEHKAWVRRFGEDLQSRGITVWLDQFVVRLGDDVTKFMEKSVSEADYVILICTDNFGAKSNDRRGGVGYEQSIVTSEILHAQPRRGRFVCIVRQGDPSQALPRYMQSRLWLDCRDDLTYSDAVAQLVDHILLMKVPPGIASPELSSESALVAPATRYGQPRRWVLVAGTGVARGFSPGLEALSRKLGSSLIFAHCGLVTGGWPGVDEWVARGFAEAAESTGAPLEDALLQVIVSTEEPSFSAGKLVFVKKGREEWEEPIQRADAVLLLGGLGGTKETGERALKMRKPVLPIADTGGDAKIIYLQMLKSWKAYSWMGLAESEFQRLGRPASSAIDAAVELLPKCHNAERNSD